jgi:hypothetical protein
MDGYGEVVVIVVRLHRHPHHAERRGTEGQLDRTVRCRRER